MLKSVAFANAATVVSAILYVVCVGLSYMAPDILSGLLQSWFHSVNLQALKATLPVPIGVIVIGFVTYSVLTWGVTYALTELYNRFAKEN